MFMSIARRLKTAHFRLILRIAETGTLQSAAVEIAMSQPSASRMLAEIETLVGAPLFTRHAKGMMLTTIGETILRHARQILQGFDRLETDVQQVANGRAGFVRIGTVTGPAVGMVVPVVRTVRKMASEIEFNIEVAPSMTLMRGLEEGRFDFIIARLPPDYNSQDYRIYPAALNEVVSMLVCCDHPMAERKAVRLHELTQFEWVIQDRGTPIRTAVETAFHTNHVKMPSQITNTSSLLVAMALLESSSGIAPQSNEVVRLLTDSALDVNVTRLDLVEDIMVSPYFVIVQQDRELSPAAEQVIRETLRRI
jgi:molybdate transport repressor ModE-like protein|tara:strand:+ start:143 stop:1069 length:927 start_codon:yes stop_codon:yes gene_type:complete